MNLYLYFNKEAIMSDESGETKPNMFNNEAIMSEETDETKPNLHIHRRPTADDKIAQVRAERSKDAKPLPKNMPQTRYQ